jgi:hypothetical protein
MPMRIVPSCQLWHYKTLLTKHQDFLRTLTATNTPAITPTTTAITICSNNANFPFKGVSAPVTIHAIITITTSFAPINANASLPARFLITLKEVAPVIAPKTAPVSAPNINTFIPAPTFAAATAANAGNRNISTPPIAAPPPIAPTSNIRLLRFCFVITCS